MALLKALLLDGHTQINFISSSVPYSIPVISKIREYVFQNARFYSLFGTIFARTRINLLRKFDDEVTKFTRAPVAHQVSNVLFRYLSGQLDTCWVI